jgi:tagaturonate reductase
MQKLKPALNRRLLEDKLIETEVANYHRELLDYPEKVIQFGEGNFLRAFVEWMFHNMNKQGLFKGRVVVVQPIPQGRVANLNEQDGLYTLILRGLQGGKLIDKKEIIPTISRGLEAYSQWEEVLKCAENPEIEYLISNTTEAGISYNPEEQLNDTPPASFPGKVTVYLYRRYQYFKGDPTKGMVIIPCELIDRNGDNLKRIVLRLAREWGLPQGFIDWINNANYFLNTLVDRIVTGYPFNEVENIEKELGYRDQNLNTGEIFHLWVIEGDKSLSKCLPFTEVGLNVKWVDDLTPYRTRKVRILNGAHTSSYALSYLSGIDLVRDAVKDEIVGEFMRETIFEEIIPTLDLDTEELKDFAMDVLERFKNPFIAHKWQDIALNATSKFKARVLPSLQEYIKKEGVIPKNLAFSLATMIAFYQGTEIRDNKLVGHRKGREYLVSDDLSALEFFRKLWKDYDAGKSDPITLARQVLANTDFWGEDLNNVSGLAVKVGAYLQGILSEGMGKSVEKLVCTPLLVG